MATNSATVKASNDNTLSRWLFNPFYYVAGGKSLTIGIIILLMTGLLGYIGKFRFDGLLDFHMGSLKPPLWLSIIENLLSWLVLSLLLLSVGMLLSKSRVRIIDVFGTQALARFPYLIVAFAALIPGTHEFARSLASGRIPHAFSTDLMVFAITALLSLIMLVWMVALMYRAFATSFNVSGDKAIVLFIISIIIGEIVSKIILFQIGRNAL